MKKENLSNGEYGILTEIQRFTVHDGPGVRSMAFLKGCPLRCKWCQNPETWNTHPELLHSPDECINCGKCVTVCSSNAINITSGGMEIDRKKCVNCGDCAKTCYSGALKITGEYMTVEEVFKALMEDEIFYKNSGGGITLSGGECTMQAEFVIQLLKKLKEHGIHTAIETCGHCQKEKFERITEYVDRILYDIKIPYDEKSRTFTGQGNELILSNLKVASEQGKDIILRFPMIPGVNDDKASLNAIADIAIKNNIKRINILPFHQAGTSKWKAIGRKYTFENYEVPTEDEIDAALEVLLNRGLDASVGGTKS